MIIPQDGHDLIVVEAIGLNLSGVLFRYRKGRVVGLIERVLSINPGLSATAILPLGARIKVPVDDVPDSGAPVIESPMQYFS